jgi:hypothetical protein
MSSPFANVKQAAPIKLPVFYPDLSPAVRREVRRLYIQQQKGRCYHCDNKLSEEPPTHICQLDINEELFPKGFFDHPTHLHHDHNTGMTIGAVHSFCNAVLWQHHGE